MIMSFCQYRRTRGCVGDISVSVQVSLDDVQMGREGLESVERTNINHAKYWLGAQKGNGCLVAGVYTCRAPIG